MTQTEARDPRQPAAAAEGFVVVDKPAGWTSHDVVARIRRLAGTRRVGHAGTLDPMATGVLVVGIGRATRLLGYLSGHDKEYAATIRLGWGTTTDDAEGERLPRLAADLPGPDQIDASVARLTGPILQRPSAVSAIKVGGKRAHVRVREGEEVDLPERPVVVHQFDVLAVRPAPALGAVDLDVVVTVSAGTYVRALARDLGESLGVGGHLTALRRTRSGAFGLSEARTLDELAGHVRVAPPDAEAALDPLDLDRRPLDRRPLDRLPLDRLPLDPMPLDPMPLDPLPLDPLPLDAVAAQAFPVVTVDEADAVRVSYGQRIAVSDPGLPESQVHALLDQQGVLLALAEPRDATWRYLAVMAPRP